jgi:hypothetical protein
MNRNTDRSAGSFAYSFDRETYRGEFPTRLEAFNAAKAALADGHEMPEAIYVGRRVVVDAQAAGHATEVLRAMRRRMADKTGDTEYLRRVNDQQHADLDAALEKTVNEWLVRQQLVPTRAVIEHISEHPVPTAMGTTRTGSARDVQILGPEGYNA